MAQPEASRRPRPVASGAFHRALLASLFVMSATSSEAQAPVRQVLVLQSFDRGNLVNDYFTGNFRVDLDQRAGRPVNVVQVVVGPTGFVGAPEQAIVDYIRATFADRPQPDLIVTIAGPAAVFARNYRRQLFPDTPLLFAAVDRRFLRDAPLGGNETAVAVAIDFPGLVDDILQLLPKTKQVFMVMGSGLVGQFWRRELEAEFKVFQERLTFVWSTDLALPEILRRCASLPPDSAIFWISFGTDAQGGAYADERVLADLHATANAPVFGLLSPLVGHGIVGARLLSIADLSRSTAEVATRILNAALTTSIGEPRQPSREPIFDWRELQRWGIPESRLPAGSVVRYRVPSLWQAYRRTVLIVTGALIVQSLLIVGLLYQRRARQRAETESRRNLALAADAIRRQTMSALTSSITHELGQPLSAMIHNAEALEAMIGANRATPDVIGEIASDIRSQGVQATQIIERHRTMLRSHQLDKKPIDLRAVINDALALVAHEMHTRRIELAVNLSAAPVVISGDHVLLQQVLVNLVMNAMDAVAEMPPGRRRVTISTDVRETDVALAVRDTGTGLPAHLDGKLFAPFVTTKANGIGIGLTIVRTIVDAHGGALEARNNPEGGATFTVTLHRGNMRQNVSGPPGAA